MSEVKPLSAEQLELLRRVTEYGCKLADLSPREQNLAMQMWNLSPWMGHAESLQTVFIRRSAEVLLATITNERQQAAEGERRRINELAAEFAPFTVIAQLAVDGGGITVDDTLTRATEPTLIEALEAAANSLNKEQTNGN